MNCHQIVELESSRPIMGMLRRLLFISLLISIVQSHKLAKRSTPSYRVEGCFRSAPGGGKSQNMGHSASNVRCQDICRDHGYILAATKGTTCHCRNIYPQGRKVADSQCRTRCRSWLSCNNAQECCGGSQAYTVSVVGNIDVAKQVLRRIAHKWQVSTHYRKHMRNFVNKPQFRHVEADWWRSFDVKGWSNCPDGTYMTGVWRNNNNQDNDGIHLIELAECKSAAAHLFSAGKGDQDCYKLDIWKTWDSKNWATCKAGYYMSGIYNTEGHRLHNIEEFHCCRPKSQHKSWGSCYNHDAWASLNDKGWTKCNNGYYMVGMYRNDCNNLWCIEEFKCCQMGSYNQDSYVDKPIITIKTMGTHGRLKECTMDAMDKTPESKTYSCKAVSSRQNILKLDAVEFKVEDKTQPTTAKPERVKNFKPVICSASNNAYTCTKTLKTAIETTTSLVIGTGFEMGVSVSNTVGVSAEAFGVSASSEFSVQVSASTSFNVERTKSKTITVEDETKVDVKVPAHKQIMIDLLRKKVDIIYKWKGIFRLLGKYKLSWSNGDQTTQDITTVLSGTNRDMYAFGTWNYPGTDVLQVLVTDQYGNKKTECQHKTGSKKDCSVAGL
uniref:WSC domain-containing protein n=1 Tax=Clytia hemisphaerica TaxID=252671 RepID=A0A069DMZ3_9CNID